MPLHSQHKTTRLISERRAIKLIEAAIIGMSVAALAIAVFA